MNIPKKKCTEDELLYFQENPVGFVSELRKEFQDIVSVEMGQNNYIFPFKPDYIGKIIEEKKVGRTSFSQVFDPILGGSLILNEGEEWKRQRKMLSPFFFSPKLNIDSVNEIAEAAISNWEEFAEKNEPVDAKQTVVLYCMNVLSELVFGNSISPETLKDIYKNWNIALNCFAKTMGSGATKEDTHEMEQACEKIESILLELIEQKRNSNHFGEDILSSLLKPGTDGTAAMTDTDIMQNIKGLFIAGFETIAGALLWCLSDLAVHQKWQELLREEILSESFKIGEDTGVMRMCFNESLRLHPPLVFIDRGLRTDIDLGDLTLSMGDEVLMCPYIVQRDPRFWDNVLAYDPERKETEQYIREATYQYFPYGGGPMKCMGEKISVIERNVLLKKILSKYQIKLMDDKEIKADNALALRPESLMIKLIKI